MAIHGTSYLTPNTPGLRSCGRIRGKDPCTRTKSRLRTATEMSYEPSSAVEYPASASLSRSSATAAADSRFASVAIVVAMAARDTDPAADSCARIAQRYNCGTTVSSSWRSLEIRNRSGAAVVESLTSTAPPGPSRSCVPPIGPVQQRRRRSSPTLGARLCIQRSSPISPSCADLDSPSRPRASKNRTHVWRLVRTERRASGALADACASVTSLDASSTNTAEKILSDATIS